MTTPRVKICGIRTSAELEMAVAAGADAIGVLVDVPVDSPREIDIQQARSIVEQCPPFLTSVLVTLPSTLEETVTLVETVAPDRLQVHGECSRSMLEALATHQPVIRAVESTDTDAIESARPIVDAVLLDSTDAAGGGGTGRTHDWDLAADRVARLDTPVILAGGLTPENVATAVARVEPYGVDVASGVDGDHGKDAVAVHRFVERARSVTPSAPGWS